MKKSLLFLLGVVILFASCKEDEIDVFSGESNIFFSLTRWKAVQGADKGASYNLEYPLAGKIYTQKWESITTSRDSMICSYALDATGRDFDTVFIPVSVIGNLMDYNRKVDFKVLGGDAVEGRDFKILEAMVPADKPVGAIVIEVNRESIKNTAYFADFALLPNSDFQTNYKSIERSSTDTTKVDVCKFRLRISDLLEEPPMWLILSNWFGPFSRKKLYLIAELTGGDLNIFYSTTPDLASMMSWAKVLKYYLQDEKNKGNTILDEDGKAMTVGQYA